MLLVVFVVLTLELFQVDAMAVYQNKKSRVQCNTLKIMVFFCSSRVPKWGFPHFTLPQPIPWGL